jgi:ABC-type uncharacterized transport system auxiliary subunit
MMRIAAPLLCLALAGCLTNEPAPPVAQTPPAQPAATATPDKPEPPQRRAAPAATRGANAPAVPVEPAPDAVMEIRQTCWSEGNKLRVSVEARADWANKCIADKTRELAKP